MRPQYHPHPVMRVLHVALPTLFVTMSGAFVAIPYQLGQLPGAVMAHPITASVLAYLN
jgi:hypothetical protein